MASSLYPVDWPFAIFKVLTGEHRDISIVVLQSQRLAFKGYFGGFLPAIALKEPQVKRSLVSWA